MTFHRLVKHLDYQLTADHPVSTFRLGKLGIIPKAESNINFSRSV